MEKFANAELWAQLVIFGPLGAFLVAAAITDARTRKIPNQLSYSSIPVGLVCHAIVMGFGGLGWAFLAVVITFVIGLILSALGWLGGGDVKLLMGVGAFLGLGGLGEVFFYAVFAGSAIGLVVTLINGYLKDMVIRIFRFMRGLIRQVMYGTKMVREDLETDPRGKLPFAVPILAGAILAYTEAAFGWPGLLTWFLNPLGGG